MTTAIKEKSFDSHGILIDRNTAFWYVPQEGALSSEYQRHPTDKQIEWEYHQGPIHISYFMFFYCSLFSSAMFNCASHYSFSAVFSLTPISAFSHFSSSPCSPFLSPLMLCMASSGGPQSGIRKQKTQIPPGLFSEDQTCNAMIRWHTLCVILDFHYHSDQLRMILCEQICKWNIIMLPHQLKNFNIRNKFPCMNDNGEMSLQRNNFSTGLTYTRLFCQNVFFIWTELTSIASVDHFVRLLKRRIFIP